MSTMKFRSNAIFSSLWLMVALSLNAQNIQEVENPSNIPHTQNTGNSFDAIAYKITGRMLMDGGVYLKNPGDFGHGTEFNDLRIGVKASYQNWGMKLEMGYAGNKAAIKDAFARYSYKNSSIQVGQFYEPFSLDMLCSTFDLRFNQSPGAVLALTNSRRMGIAYTYHTKHYYLCGGFFTDNDLSNLKNASQGYAIDGRFVYRPVYEKGKLLHLGLAAIHRTPDGSLAEEEIRNTFTYKSPGVSTIDNRNLLLAQVDNSTSQLKIGAELLVYYHKFFLQSEYIRAHVNRKDGIQDYVAQGMYAQCSWLLLGRNYLYDEEVACPGRPEGKSLELCARFNYLDLNDAGIQGGVQKDLSIGLNYYLNKHIAVKLNYSYFISGAYVKEINNNNFSVLQGRFQFIF